ncbi:unnamed protein product [Strongylus vulgaris]|uniref:Uncharacterized protein n=1 Tax=Strongylus vulgaris TaxID=40348 RepID=A0A3P7LG67_STRVU|nr:unnamed protein product [Strongylus vulgaris]
MYRYPDLRNIARAIPSFSSLCEDEYRKVDREFQARRDFKWTRFASSNDEDSMAPRGLHSMAYHEKECAMYAFGGEAPDWRLQGEACGPASFNDLWRLDMTSLKWSRVVVKSSPYPLPKYLCSMVVYKDSALFGLFTDTKVSGLEEYSFMVGSSSLVVLREGCLLATGENMRDDLPENTSILFIFDPKNPEGVEWQYKLIPLVMLYLFILILALFLGYWSMVASSWHVTTTVK